MRHSAGDHWRYLASALLLSLAECLFFYTGSDSAVDGSLAGWLGAARGKSLAESGLEPSPANAESESVEAEPENEDDGRDSAGAAMPPEVDAGDESAAGGDRAATGHRPGWNPAQAGPWIKDLNDPRGRARSRLLAGRQRENPWSGAKSGSTDALSGGWRLRPQRLGGPGGDILRGQEQRSALHWKMPAALAPKRGWQWGKSWVRSSRAQRASMTEETSPLQWAGFAFPAGGGNASPGHWLHGPGGPASPDWDGSGRHARTGGHPAVFFEARGGFLRNRGSFAMHGSKTRGGAPAKQERRPRNESISGIPFPALRQLLGSGVLKPPQGRLEPPDFSRLDNGPQPASPDGRRFKWLSLSAEEAESLSPPDAMPEYKEWTAREQEPSSPHWHAAGDARYFHQGPLWAVPAGNRWAVMIRADRHWWTLADGHQPLIRHQGHWWWKEGGTWFLLHHGEPWAYRYFGEWRQSGLIQPQTDTRVIYSEDESKAAVVTPGQGTALFDLRTGSEIRRWSARRRPAGLKRNN